MRVHEDDGDGVLINNGCQCGDDNEVSVRQCMCNHTLEKIGF